MNYTARLRLCSVSERSSSYKNINADPIAIVSNIQSVKCQRFSLFSNQFQT